jgi:hypothetical protein
MRPVRSTLASALALALVLPRAAPAQPAPDAGAAIPAPAPATPVAGGLEVRVGVAGIVLPEASGGSFSAQPEIRVGWFLADRLELQAEGSARVWPLGSVAPHSIGTVFNVLWFPPLGAGRRDLYLLAGGGGAYADPPVGDAAFDPLLRGGLGVTAPMAGLVPAWTSISFAVEYRGELVLADDADFVSGVSLGLLRSL